MNKSLPQKLTTYDLLKTLAIVLVLVDHVGYYMLDNETIFRVLGRLCVPIWFFLIGYAKTREVPKAAYVGTALIAAGNILAGEYLLPFSILMTLMIGRLYKDIWMRAVHKGGEALAGLFFFCLLGYLPTAAVFEYGSFGFFFVIFGALMRVKADSPELYTDRVRRQGGLFVAGGFIVFTLWETIKFTELYMWHLGVLVVCMSGVALMLTRFQGRELSAVDAKTPLPVKKLLQFTGRQTLWIYVVTLLALKAYAVIYVPENFTFMDWEYFRPGFITFMMNMF